eukprot:SAG11_NODE_1529_length_4738_cov_1.628799_7_plen_59_part_00
MYLPMEISKIVQKVLIFPFFDLVRPQVLLILHVASNTGKNKYRIFTVVLNLNLKFSLS